MVILRSHGLTFRTGESTDHSSRTSIVSGEHNCAAQCSTMRRSRIRNQFFDSSQLFIFYGMTRSIDPFDGTRKFVNYNRNFLPMKYTRSSSNRLRNSRKNVSLCADTTANIWAGRKKHNHSLRCAHTADFGSPSSGEDKGYRDEKFILAPLIIDFQCIVRVCR